MEHMRVRDLMPRLGYGSMPQQEAGVLLQPSTVLQSCPREAKLTVVSYRAMSHRVMSRRAPLSAPMGRMLPLRKYYQTC
jgi:hypothetical protein